MKDQVEFGVLQDVDLRIAWKDEAIHFTPWLGENLPRLGAAVGLELEAIRIEASLPTVDDSFSADILARNLDDDSNVLIENQLERSDHRHLGQILTYLAGLEARTVIWVAPQFREAHLAAIKWLNENTRDEISFFAVKIRVVQIGASPLAPLFDVLEQPNTWEKRQRTSARVAKEASDVSQQRRHFWEQFFAKYPAHSADGTAGGIPVQWKRWQGGKLMVAYYISKNNVGVYVRGDNSVPPEETAALLAPFASTLSESLETEFGPNRQGHFLMKSLPCSYVSEADFPRVSAWLNEQIARHVHVLNETLISID